MTQNPPLLRAHSISLSFPQYQDREMDRELVLLHLIIKLETLQKHTPIFTLLNWNSIRSISIWLLHCHSFWWHQMGIYLYMSGIVFLNWSMIFLENKFTAPSFARSHYLWHQRFQLHICREVSYYFIIIIMAVRPYLIDCPNLFPLLETQLLLCNFISFLLFIQSILLSIYKVSIFVEFTINSKDRQA